MDSILFAILFGFLLFVENSASSPHIIFIVADDLGWNDVGWHNPDIKTPNLDRMARGGVIFNSSYMQPLCSPSRGSFLTGYYPFHTGLQHGILQYDEPGFLPEKFKLLPQKLKDLGYATHMIGKWHLGFCNLRYTPTYRGFDSFMGYYGGGEDYYTHTSGGGRHSGNLKYDFRMNENPYKPPAGEYSAVTYAKRAVEIINNHDPQKQPLFLYLPFQSVHSPLQNGGAQSSGANNAPLRGSKGTLFEGGTRVPGFAYSQNLLQQRAYVNTALIHAVDWFPTLISAAGGTPDHGIDGIDQWDTIRSNATTKRTEMVYNIDDSGGHLAMRVGDYKLIRGKLGHFTGWYPLYSNGSYQSIETNHGHTEHHALLFNLKDDPYEHNDISSQHYDIVTQLQHRLQYYRHTAVPAINPSADDSSDPQNYGGYWSPGWC